MSGPLRWWPALALIALAGGSVRAGELEDALRARWQDRWVVLRTEVYADCLPCYQSIAGCLPCYSRNLVEGADVAGYGTRRFEPGELGRVRELRVRRKALEVDIDLAEPVLVGLPRAGFVLFEDRACGVELRFEVPREVIRERNAADLEDRLAAAVEGYATAAEARAAQAWNRRTREPYPQGYEATLRDYAAWRERWLAAARQQAVRASREALPRWEDLDYLEGFSDAVERVRNEDWGGCLDLPGVRLPEPGIVGLESGAARGTGWHDGLAFSTALRLLDGIEGCRQEAAAGGVGE